MAKRVLSQSDTASEKLLLCLEFASNKQKFQDISLKSDIETIQDVLLGIQYLIIASIFHDVTVSNQNANDNYSSVLNILDSIGYKPHQPCTVSGLVSGNAEDHLNLCLIIEFVVFDKTLTKDQLISDIRRLPRSFYVLEKQVNFIEEAINIWVSKFPCIHTIPDITDAQHDIAKGYYVAGILSRVFPAQVPKSSIVINSNMTDEQIKSNWDLCKPVLNDLGVFTPSKFPIPEKLFMCFISDLFYATRVGAKKFVKVEPPPPPVAVVKPIVTPISVLPARPLIITSVINKQPRPKTSTSSSRGNNQNKKLSKQPNDTEKTKNAMSTPIVASSNNDVEIELVSIALENFTGHNDPENSQFAKVIVKFANSHKINNKEFLAKFSGKEEFAQKFFEWCRKKPEGIPPSVMKVVKKKPWIAKEKQSNESHEKHHHKHESSSKNDKKDEKQDQNKQEKKENVKNKNNENQNSKSASETSTNDKKSEKTDQSKQEKKETEKNKNHENHNSKNSTHTSSNEKKNSSKHNEDDKNHEDPKSDKNKVKDQNSKDENKELKNSDKKEIDQSQNQPKNDKNQENENIEKEKQNPAQEQPKVVDKSKLPHVKWVGVDEIAARRAMINAQKKNSLSIYGDSEESLPDEFELRMDPPKKAIPERFRLSHSKKEITAHTSTVPNISTIANALKYHALPGPAHVDEYNNLMKILQDRFSNERILILMASRTMKYKGIYILNNDVAKKIYGIGQDSIYQSDVSAFYKFVNGTKQYERILSKSFTQTTDGFSMKREKEPQSW